MFGIGGLGWLEGESYRTDGVGDDLDSEVGHVVLLLTEDNVCVY